MTNIENFGHIAKNFEIPPPTKEEIEAIQQKIDNPDFNPNKNLSQFSYREKQIYLTILEKPEVKRNAFDQDAMMLLEQYFEDNPNATQH